MIGRISCILLLLLGSNITVLSKNSTGSDAGATWESLKLREGQSLEDLLHWSIVNSDPQALEEQAKEAIKPAARTAGIPARQERVAQLLDVVKQQPSKAQLMAEAIATITNTSETQQAQRNVLAALRVLVEPIDNANDLHKLGGLQPVVALLGVPSPVLQAAAAYVLGTAASNNPPFQASLVEQHPEVVPALLHLINASHRGPSPGDKQEGPTEVEEAGNAALYAVAAMVRVHAGARALFHAAAGMQSLELLLGDPAASLRLRRKALNLIADVVQLDSGNGVQGGLDHGSAVAAILRLLTPELPSHTGSQQREAAAAAAPTAATPLGGPGAADLDLQEKALLALRVLVQHRGGSLSAESLHSAAAQLEALRVQLEASKASDGLEARGGDTFFLQDMLDLAQEVKQLYQQQLSARDRAEL